MASLRRKVRITLATESIPSDLLSHILHFLDNATVWEVCRVNRVRACAAICVCLRMARVNSLAMVIVSVAGCVGVFEFDADDDMVVRVQWPACNAVARTCTGCV
jgi:hypothetical protein